MTAYNRTTDESIEIREWASIPTRNTGHDVDITLGSAVLSIPAGTTLHDALVTIGTAPTTINIIIGGGGSAITTGVKGDVELPFAGTITAARLFADQSGSIVIDLWKDTYANYPPVDADSITASAPPTISAATKSEDTTLTGWTTTFAAGDVIRVNVDSAVTITRATLSLSVSRS